MKPNTDERRAYNDSCREAREQYRHEFHRCQWCGTTGSEVHEIARGPGRRKALGVRAAWLHLCRDCHREIASIPPAGQLAIKWLGDPVGYDRVTVNRLRGRADNAISEAEVLVWVMRFTRPANDQTRVARELYR